MNRQTFSFTADGNELNTQLSTHLLLISSFNIHNRSKFPVKKINQLVDKWIESQLNKQEQRNVNYVIL